MNLSTFLVCLGMLCTLQWSTSSFFVEAARDQIKFNWNARLAIYQSPYVHYTVPTLCSYNYDANRVFCNIYKDYPNYYFILDVSRPRACANIINNNTKIKKVELFEVKKRILRDDELVSTDLIGNNYYNKDDTNTQYMKLHRIRLTTSSSCTFTLDYESIKIRKH